MQGDSCWRLKGDFNISINLLNLNPTFVLNNVIFRYRLQIIKNNVTKTSIDSKSAPAPTNALLESSFPLLGEVQKFIPRTVVIPEESTSTEVVPEQEIANPSKKKRPEKFLSVNLEQLLELSAKNKVVTTKKKKIKIKKVCFEEKLSGNPLDSSQPIRHRGKNREIPKKKKKSSLKLAILAYRLVTPYSFILKFGTPRNFFFHRKLKELQKINFDKKSSVKDEYLEEKVSSSSEVKFNEDISVATSSSSGQTEIKNSEDCAEDAFKFTTLDLIHSRKFRE
jgi:hypothetical protein